MDVGERLCRAERGRLDDLTERIAAMRRAVAGGPASDVDLSPSKKGPEPLTKDAVKSELLATVNAGLLAKCPHCSGTVAPGLMDAHMLTCPSAPGSGEQTTLQSS